MECCPSQGLRDSARGESWERETGCCTDESTPDPSPATVDTVTAVNVLRKERSRMCAEWNAGHIMPFAWCQHCSKLQPAQLIDTHLKIECARFVAQCPNQGCSWRGPKQFLKMHVQEICPLAIVPCPFALAGCPGKVPRALVEEHLVRDVGTHLRLMTEDNRMLRECFAAMEKTAWQLEARLANLETVLSENSSEDGRSVRSGVESAYSSPRSSFEAVRKKKRGYSSSLDG